MKSDGSSGSGEKGEKRSAGSHPVGMNTTRLDMDVGGSSTEDNNNGQLFYTRGQQGQAHSAHSAKPQTYT